MSQRNRALALLGALVVLVVAFVALRPGDEDDTPATAATTTTETTIDVTTTATTTGDPTATTDTTTTTAPKPKPKVPIVRVAGLKPVGGVKTIKAHKNDTVRFVVTSDQPESVHLHGYDVEKPVAPGKAARYAFKANIEGIFEVELEHSGVPLITLRVDP